MVHEKSKKERKESWVLCSYSIMFSKHNGLWVDSHTFGCVVCFVDADEAICDLKHVVPQRDDDELSILCLFLQPEG